MSRWKTVPLFASLAIGALTLVLRAEDKAPESPGATIYAKKCQSCHGPDGKGVAKMAEMLKVPIPDLTAPPADREEAIANWTKEIADGEGKMPGFAKKLSAEELKAVTDYSIATYLAEPAKK